MQTKTTDKTKIIWKVVRIFVIIISGLLLGVNVYLLNAERVARNDLPMPFGRGFAIVLSGSMEPELSVDDMIFVKKTDDFSVGDVVVFHDKGSLIVHRVKSIDGDTVTTKGDANNAADEPISTDSVEGIVTGHLSNVGGIVRALKSPVGIIIILAIAVFLMELSFKSEKKNGDKELEEYIEELKRLKNGQ